MLNFREELEAIKAEMPSDQEHKISEQILRDVLDHLKTMNCTKFHRITKIIFCFQREDDSILMKINEKDILLYKKVNHFMAPNIFRALRGMVKESYPEKFEKIGENCFCLYF